MIGMQAEVCKCLSVMWLNNQCQDQHIAISTDVTCYASLYILDHSVNGSTIIQLKLGETHEGGGDVSSSRQINSIMQLCKNIKPNKHIPHGGKLLIGYASK